MVDEVGDPKKIATKEARMTTDPRDLMMAENVAGKETHTGRAHIADEAKDYCHNGDESSQKQVIYSGPSQIQPLQQLADCTNQDHIRRKRTPLQRHISGNVLFTFADNPD